MIFTESEIEKAKELKRLKLNPILRVGSYLYARHCPSGCVPIQDNIFLITELHADQADLLWLPTIDDLITVCRERQISFSYITDYLHRKRFADSNEREGIYQLLIERLR